MTLDYHKNITLYRIKIASSYKSNYIILENKIFFYIFAVNKNLNYYVWFLNHSGNGSLNLREFSILKE